MFFLIDLGSVETTWSRGSIAIIDLIYLNKYTPKVLGDTKTSNKRAKRDLLTYKTIYILKACSIHYTCRQNKNIKQKYPTEK